HEGGAGGHILQMNWRPDWQRMRGLLTLGVPVAAQIALEGAVFAVVSVMAAKLDPVSLGAHVIGVNVISITFMVPLGISAAAALRGMGDTRSPAVAHFAGYWIVGLPVGYALCFRYGWGVRGLWIGLTVALVLVGAGLLLVWRARERARVREFGFR